MQAVHTTTNVVSSNPAHGEMYSLQRYVIKFVSDLRQVGGFLRVLWKVALNNKTQTLYDYIIHRCKKNRRLWIKLLIDSILISYKLSLIIKVTLFQNIINNNLMEHQLMHFPYWNIIPTVKYLIQSLRFFLVIIQLFNYLLITWQFDCNFIEQ
jgi:hypothetical protein